MLELHFSVAGYGGLRLPFRGYLHGLVSVYKRPIIAGGRVWMAYSTKIKTPGACKRHVLFEKSLRPDLENVTNCLSALRSVPPGCLRKWNLAGKFANFNHACKTAP